MARLATVALLTWLVCSCPIRAEKPTPAETEEAERRMAALGLRLRAIVRPQDLSAPPDERRITSAVFSPDGRLLALASYDRSIRLYDVATGRLQGTIPTGQRGLWCIAFAPDGKRIASAAWGDGAIRLWDIAARREVGAFKGDHCVAFAPDGKSLACSSNGCAVRLWQIDPPRELKVFSVEAAEVVAFAAEGKTLIASGGLRNGLMIGWAIDSGKESFRLTFEQGGYRPMALGCDRRLLVTAEGPGALILRQLSFPHEVERRAQGKDPFLRVVFSPDQRTLLTADVHGRVSAWEVASGQERLQLPAMPGPAEIAFSPTGRCFAFANQDGTACLVDYYPPESATLTRRQEETYWSGLASPNAARAFSAIHALTAARSTAFIKDRLTQSAALRLRVTPLLVALDDRRYSVREVATKDLAKLGKIAEFDLRLALERTQSLDTKRRLERVLAELDQRPMDGDILAGLRAIEVLEVIGTPEAVEVLRHIEKSGIIELIEREAKASMARLQLKHSRKR